MVTNNEQPECTFEEFMRQVRRTKHNAGHGIDQLSRDVVVNLHVDGQRALHNIVGGILWQIVLPGQFLAAIAVAAIVALIPKPGSNAYRPIALLHFVYRWIQKMLCKEVSE